MSICPDCDNFAALQRAVCDEKAYRWHVLKSLCYLIELLGAEEAESISVTNVLPQVSKTYTQLNSTYTDFASVGLIDAAKKLNYIRVVNASDTDLEFSYDGGDEVAFTVLKTTTYTETLNLNLSQTTSLQMKKVTGQTATTGKVLIEGRYNS